MVSLPFPFRERMPEYLDRVYGNFYVGFILTTTRNSRITSPLSSQSHRVRLSQNLDERILHQCQRGAILLRSDG